MDYEDEIFTDIEGFENYAVSNYARVLKKTTQRFSKPCLNDKGYLKVTLSKNNKAFKHYLHRLVANAFIKNNQNEPIIDHIDRNKQNNSLSNLRWTNYNVNNANKLKSTNKSSKYMGVSFHKTRNKFRAQIQIDKKKIHIGCFEAEIDAANARNQYIITNKLVGVYRTNEID